MARATNALTQGISGKLGVLVFRQQADGSPAVVTAAPKRSKRKPRTVEALNRDRFRQAAAYGSRVQSDRGLRALYGARKTAKLRSAYHVALADARNPPKVTGYAAPARPLGAGQVVRVEAKDDFEVTRVVVRLEAADGTRLEEGEATPPAAGQQADWWRYAVQGVVEVGSVLVATAYDRPGNATTERWMLA